LNRTTGPKICSAEQIMSF